MKGKKWNRTKVTNYYKNCHRRWDFPRRLAWKIFGFPSFLYQRKRLIETKNEILKLNLSARVLDTPCGDGFLLNFLPKGSVGIDIDPYLVRKARKVSENEAIVGDFEKIPYKSGSFKAVLAAEIFEHLPDPAPAIKEMWRILEKNGKLIVTVPTENPLWKIRFLASPMSLTEPQCLSFSRKSLLRLFHKCDYRVKKFKKIAWGLNYFMVLEKRA